MKPDDLCTSHTFSFHFSFIKNIVLCEPLGPIDNEQYNQYSLIAKGKVLKVSVHNFEKTIFFAVETKYKGDNKQGEIKIITPAQEGECSLVAKVGENWLMFACSDGNAFSTELCTRTKNMNPKAWDYQKGEIADDIKFLETKLISNGR